MQCKTALSCLLFAVLGAISCAASAGSTYAISLVGTLGNGDGSAANGGLNNSGQVVGYSYDSNFAPKAYVSMGGQITNLNPAGASFSSANGINDAGIIVGNVTYGTTHATVFNNGSVTDLGTLGGSNSYAYGINNAGTVVGTSYLSGDSTFHAYMAQGGDLTDIKPLTGHDGFSEAMAINDRGQVVGYSSSTDDGSHAFSYLNGQMTDLGTLGGLYSGANAVNGGGMIVGYAYLAGDVISHGFVYANGVMIDLGTLGTTQSYAYDINDAGDVVGGLETDIDNGARIDRSAFLYSKGKMIDLNSLIDSASGWDLQWASAINDKGQISARGCSISAGCQDLLLTQVDVPSDVPEPEAFTAGIAGLALAGLLRRRARRVKA
jgi:probable HAF family extracellular repeat protein